MLIRHHILSQSIFLPALYSTQDIDYEYSNLDLAFFNVYAKQWKILNMHMLVSAF